MKDMILLEVEIIIKANIRQIDKDKTKIIFSNLLKFASDKGMLINNPFDEYGNLMKNIIIKESDLTDRGKQYFEELMDKWLMYTDKDDSKIDRLNNIKMLDKYYDKLTKDDE